MSIRTLAAIVAAVAALAAGIAGAAEDKWQITSKMEMTGMPFAMPEQTTTVCAPQGQKNEKLVPAKDNCKVTGFKTSGNTSSFHVECPAPDKMSGDGQFTVLGPDSTKGQMTMKAVVDGRPTDMKMSWSSKKLGVCDAVKDKAISPTAMMAQAQAQTAQGCKEMAKGMGWQYADQLVAACPTLKADICKAAKSLFDSPKTSTAALDMREQRGDWKELAGYCGMDVAPYTKKYCALAKAEQNWNNASVLCGKDPELEAVARRECTGKMYTAGLVDDKYQSLCALYSDQIDPGTPPEPSKAAKAADTGKRALDGVKKLKGLFGN